MTITDTLIRQKLADNPLAEKSAASQDDDASGDGILLGIFSAMRPLWG